MESACPVATLKRIRHPGEMGKSSAGRFTLNLSLLIVMWLLFFRYFDGNIDDTLRFAKQIASYNAWILIAPLMAACGFCLVILMLGRHVQLNSTERQS